MNLSEYSRSQLLELCEELDIPFYKSKNKTELINIIEKKVDEIELENEEIVEEKLENTFIPFEEEVPKLKLKINVKIDSMKNNVFVGNNMDILKNIENNSVDLVVTSPPYDDLRDYKGNYKFDLTELGKEIYRVLKDGGIYAMVIQDQTKDFAKSLTSFRTVINHCDIVGFKLFETCIYKKQGVEGAWWKKRFRVDHEYIHLFLKGKKPQYFNKEPIKIPSKHAGKIMTGCATRKTDGTTFKCKEVLINDVKCPGTIWDYANGGDKNKLKRKHPAVFPDKIPNDLIQVFCPEGDRKSVV